MLRKIPTRRCTGCGEMLDENSQFCSNCGYDMENGVPNVIEREIKERLI